MKSRVSLALMLICMLLSNAVHGVGWQGTGSGMNSTVITEIWFSLESNLNTALATDSQSGYNDFTKQISDRLNNRWNQAWNVVLAKTKTISDTVLYGYAFRNQWMWFNGVPNNVLGSSSIATLIVWKDYNCMDWGYIGGESTSLSSELKDSIEQFVYTRAQDEFSDIWRLSFNLMQYVEQYAESAGGYSIIMSQDSDWRSYGRICKVGTKFYAILQGTNTCFDQQLGQEQSIK